ncbi:MAG TPA: ATP-binding protein [Thermoanaerobaculia bacterium]|nr:ATP-binding protein [Thermoanaerobaculia bacterium]
MSDPTASLLPFFDLPENLILDLKRMNPWWEGKPLPVLPWTRRHLVRQIRHRLNLRLAPIVVVRGPRQIGKTTAQMQVVRDLLDEGVPPRNIFRLQADELPQLAAATEPILRLMDWYEGAVLGGTLNEVAHRGEPTYLFFDEVQNLRDWAPQLKSLVDHSTTQVVLTGSSALRIEIGRDSLAGRIHSIEAGVLSLTEVADFHNLDLGRPLLGDNGLDHIAELDFWHQARRAGLQRAEARDEAFRRFARRGGYPIVHSRWDVDWSYLKDQINETVIKRVIQHDLRLGERGRKRDPQLLEEVFRLGCRYVGQAPTPKLLAQEVHESLGANVGPERVRQYLRFLGDTLLLRLIPPLEIRLKRTKGQPKLCLADHALRSSWLQEEVPIEPDDLRQNPELTPLAGRLAESIVGTALSSISNLDLTHLPERADQPEVDFVLTLGLRRIPLEVKYRRQIDPFDDTEGLRRFIEKAANKASFGILVTQTDTEAVLDPRIVALPLSSLLMLR